MKSQTPQKPRTIKAPSGTKRTKMREWTALTPSHAKNMKKGIKSKRGQQKGGQTTTHCGPSGVSVCSILKISMSLVRTNPLFLGRFHGFLSIKRRRFPLLSLAAFKGFLSKHSPFAFGHSIKRPVKTLVSQLLRIHNHLS